VLTLRLAPPASTSEAEAARLYEEVVERVAHLPGVQAAGVTSHLPFSRTGTRQGYAVEGQTASEAPVADLRQVTPAYFAALGVPLLRGRALASGDAAGARPVVVVSDGLARRVWPGADPRGRRLLFRGSTWEVVGVVGDVRHQGLGEPPSPTLYVAQRQAPSADVFLVVRTATDPASLAGAVRREVARVDAGAAVSAVAPMRRVVADFAAPERITVQLLTAFALCALVIAVGGIYGVVSYSVAQRTQEFGTRLALGAHPDSILRLVLRQGLTLSLAGVALGTAGAYAVVRLLSSFFFGVEGSGVLIPLGSGALMVLAALLASYFPAREAVNVDPILALRRE
jgi:predicted permease